MKQISVETQERYMKYILSNGQPVRDDERILFEVMTLTPNNVPFFVSSWALSIKSMYWVACVSSLPFGFLYRLHEEFDDTKGLTKIRKSKDRKHV
jgi:hypothetical protein